MTRDDIAHIARHLDRIEEVLANGRAALSDLRAKEPANPYVEEPESDASLARIKTLAEQAHVLHVAAEDFNRHMVAIVLLHMRPDPEVLGSTER